MKILYIDPQSIANMALYDYNLIRNLKDEIIYCCSTMYDAPIMDGVDYRYIFKYNKKKRIAKLFSYLRSLVLILIIAQDKRPDVIHIQWWRVWIVDYLLLFLLKRYTKQIVFTAHNVVPHETGEKEKRKCIKYYKKVDKIIVHVDRTKQELVSDFNIESNKIFVIPHGLLDFRVDSIKVEKERKVLNEILHTNDKIVVTAIGNQSLYKGTDLIVEAYAKSLFLQNSSNFLLIIAGRGDIANIDLMSKYKNVYVNNTQLADAKFHAILSVTDVLLLPYRRISQSGVLLTAIEQQIPYVATDVGGLTEPFDIALIGWKMAGNSSECLRILLEDIVKNPIETSEKRNNSNGWKQIKSYYQWDKIAQLTHDCYQKVV